MGSVAPFHSLYESDKTAPRYHDNDTCTQARKMPEADIRTGSGGFYHCEECIKLDQQQETIAQASAAAFVRQREPIQAP